MTGPVGRRPLPDARVDRLYYATVHEDPRLELEALRPGPEDVIVTVASGGCTALSLLAAGAGRVEAVDLNPAQNHTVELKLAACRLGGEEATAFLGGRPASARWRRLAYASLRSELSPAARAYWDARGRIVGRGVLGSGVSERFIGALRRVLIPLVHPPSRVRRLLACESPEAQRELYASEWDTRRWRALFALLLRRRSMERAYDPAFFAHVENASFSEHFRRVFERTVTELPVADNYFLHFALTGRYPDGARPDYLTEAGAEAAYAGRERLLLVDGTFTSRLRELPDASVTGFALSNICEWLSPEEVDELFAQIARTARPGARVCLRNFVGWSEVPARWRVRVVEDRAAGEALFRRERSLVNRRFALCTAVPAGARSERLRPGGAKATPSLSAAAGGGTREDVVSPPVSIAPRDATPADNSALLRLAAACPMMGEVAICVERAPDFFALSRLQGEVCRVGVAEAEGEVAGCVSVALRRTYLRGRPASTLYLSDLKVHPRHRGGATADALSRWAREASSRLGGDKAPALMVVLAGNRPMERRAAGPRELPRFRRIATIRSISMPLLWPARRPVENGRNGRPRLRRAAADDLERMALLWGRVAPGRQFAPVVDVEGLERFIAAAPGLEASSYLLAEDPGGRLLGFFGLWDQERFKQMRVVRYAAGSTRVRRAFNLLAPALRATPLPPPGRLFRHLTGVHVCVPPDRPEVLRALLLRARAEARAGGYSFLSLALDACDPLNRSFRGIWTQETRVHAYVTTAAGSYDGPALDERPLHFETALV